MAADRRSPVTKTVKPASKPAAAPPRKSPAKTAAVVAADVTRTAVPAKPAKNGYELEEQIGFLLRKAHQRATLIFNEIMGRFDITPTQFAALAKIDDEGAISQNHLGRLTAMDPSTILGVIGRLQRQGFVHLRSTPGDARLTMIELTLDGQRRVAEMKAVATEVSKRILATLKPADAKTLNELLARIG